MVTNEHVRQWLGGSGNIEIDDMVELIKIIANGTYKPEQLYEDIKGSWDFAMITDWNDV